MTRQVRLPNEIADALERRYPGKSLSAAATAAIKASFDAPPTPAVSAVVPSEWTEPTVASVRSAARHPQRRGGPCLHPITRRRGRDCGVCGKPVFS